MYCGSVFMCLWAHGSIRHPVCSSSLVLQVRWDGRLVMVHFSSCRNLHSRDREFNRVSVSHTIFQLSCYISQCYSPGQTLPRQVSDTSHTGDCGICSVIRVFSNAKKENKQTNVFYHVALQLLTN